MADKTTDSAVSENETAAATEDVAAAVENADTVDISAVPEADETEIVLLDGERVKRADYLASETETDETEIVGLNGERYKRSEYKDGD